ncbi:S-methyl-5-thioribose-1-phosphate isomerase [Patescibacteria group bacterium]|nr:S-methyl-5-thioribose-1-phosphate isomerase [Patescibacteria group bacterium]
MDNLIQKTFKDIKSLKVQGATDVAIAIMQAISDYSSRIKTNDLSVFKEKIKQAADLLLSARPTEPMAQNGIKAVLSQLKKENKNFILAQDIVQRTAEDFLIMMADAGDLVVKHGEELIKNKENIFTHCHSWLVEQILIKAWQNQKKIKVYNTETRPLFQGRVTARELLAVGIPTTMVVDSSAGFLISHHSGKELMMDKIILGADAILSDGSVINKIGSFTIALVAKQEGVPLYVAANLLKFHDQIEIKIEERSLQELWKEAPDDLKIINFAFDRIPAEYITGGIICEEGIIKPKQAKTLTQKNYQL